MAWNSLETMLNPMTIATITNTPMRIPTNPRISPAIAEPKPGLEGCFFELLNPIIPRIIATGARQPPKRPIIPRTRAAVALPFDGGALERIPCW